MLLKVICTESVEQIKKNEMFDVIEVTDNKTLTICKDNDLIEVSAEHFKVIDDTNYRKLIRKCKWCGENTSAVNTLCHTCRDIDSSGVNKYLGVINETSTEKLKVPIIKKFFK